MQNIISIILQVLDNASVNDDFTDDEIKEIDVMEDLLKCIQEAYKIKYIR